MSVRVNVRTASLREAVQDVVDASPERVSVAEVLTGLESGGFRFGVELWPFGAGEEYDSVRVHSAVLAALRDAARSGGLVESSVDGLAVFESAPVTRVPWWRGWRVTAAVVGGCVGMLVFAAALGGAANAAKDHAPVPAVSTPVSFTQDIQPAAPGQDRATLPGESDEGCQSEELPCWNSCTMGENDPRTGRPGPCDPSALLPYLRQFRVTVMPGADPALGVACDDAGRSYFARVLVWVADSDGQVVVGHSHEANGCVPRDGSLLGVVWVRDLFYTAAQDL